LYTQRMRKKRCRDCRKLKSRTEYHKHHPAKDGLQYICKDCARLKGKKYYRENKDHHRRVCTMNTQRKRKAVFDYLADHPCVDCGESDPVVLEFDHVRGEKTGGIGKMISQSRPLGLIMAEIEKCEVRCANCHKRKTAKDEGWYSRFDPFYC